MHVDVEVEVVGDGGSESSLEMFRGVVCAVCSKIYVNRYEL